ncbi:MAG: hypothetical protein QOE90_24 [Thermoplasmata archaeon]|jgi:hypothetical protein|nr:hypothetical protein [Thermoplasmata archaeon]
MATGFTALDIIVAAAALVVAVWFLVAWRRLGEPALLLFAVGLALKGVGYGVAGLADPVSSRPASAFDLTRIGVLFVGNLLMVSAYLGGRRQRAWLLAGWIVAGGAALLVAIDLVVPPLGSVDLQVASIVSASIIAVANVACAVFAAHGFRASPSAGRALVPTAFLFWGLSNYTGLLIVLGSPSWLHVLVQLWRLVAVVLMLGALVLPRGGAGPAKA